jgi:propionyl-CoA carboxylase beta chain
VSKPNPPQNSTKAKLEQLRALQESILSDGEQNAQVRQHAKGKLSARERIEKLLDPDSFSEIDDLVRHQKNNFAMDKSRIAGDGVITGFGTVDGRPVCVFSQDFSVMGGSLGEAMGQKIVKIMDLAMKTGVPMIGINDSGGARIQEGVASLAMYGEIFRRNTHASGLIPQISVIVGPCAGGAVYSPALTDFIVMADKTAHMFITGPDVIKAITGESVSFDELGGASIHSTKSGVASYMAQDENDAFEYVRLLLSYLPSNNAEPAPAFPSEAALEITQHDLEMDSLVPDSPNQPYDMHTLVEHILDEDEFFEVHANWAPNIMIGFGRVEGHTVGVVANQPMQLAGTLDIEASEKAARFVRTCDAFNIPIITFVDVPGFLPGVNQEYGGIIRRGAKLIYAYAEATVPLITVITRKAYGGAYIVMGSKHLGADVNLAWPTAQVAVMGAQGAVNILYRKDLKDAAEPAKVREEKIAEYEEAFDNPYVAAERGWIDAVIAPSETRSRIVKSLRMLRTKRETLPAKKHGNIPL